MLDYNGQPDVVLRRLARHGDQEAAWAYRERQRRQEQREQYRRQQYEEGVAWTAWRLFTSKCALIILLVLAAAWWLGLI